MTERKELEYVLQQASREQLLSGKIDRRTFLERSLVAGLGMAGVAAGTKLGMGSAFAQDRPFTPTFYDWIEQLHPGIPAVNAKFPGMNYQIAPTQGFGIERFVAEAKAGESTWDVYVGQTPFVEMSAMIKADVIERNDASKNAEYRIVWAQGGVFYEVLAAGPPLSREQILKVARSLQ